MGAKKIKGVNRFIDKPEEDLPFYERFKFWVDENTNRILAVAGTFLALWLVFWGFNYYRDSKQARAAAEYGQLISKWPGDGAAEAGAWEAFVPEIEKFVENSGGMRAALSAELDLARALYRLGRFDDAARWSARVVEEAPAGHHLKPLAVYQLALTYEALGKGDEASAQWNALKADGTPSLSREADWHLARFRSLKQDHAGAVSQYGEAIKSPGMYPSTVLLEEELALAKSKAGPQGEKDKTGTSEAESGK